MSERRLKIAVPAQVLDTDIRAAATKARQLGVEGLEIPAYTPSLRLPDLSATGLREFRHILSGQQRELAAVRVDCGPRGLGPGADVDRILNGLDRAMEAARGLGAGVVTVEIGPLPEPAREAKPRPKVTQDMAGLILIPTPAEMTAASEPAEPAIQANPAAEAQVDAAMIELGRRADRYGLPIAFHTDLASYAALDRTIRAANCPWFGIDFDPANSLRDAWPVDETLSRLGSLVRHVRARDAVKGADRRTRPAAIGAGDIHWSEILALLDEAGYHGWLTIDPTDLPDRIAGVQAALNLLRTIK